MRKSLRQQMLVVLAAAVALFAAACGSGGSATSARTPAGTTGVPEHGSRVFVIVLENHEIGQVIGNPAAPYLNRLALHGTLAARYYAITHPSLPNYLAMIGGSTFGISSDCSDCSAAGSSLPQQLSEAGIEWRAYMQGMPKRCFGGTYSGDYAKKHNPFVYFPAVRSDPALCDRIVPATRLHHDLRNRTLPSFAWITPDLCNDAHDCPIATSDHYLAGIVPALLRRTGPQGFVVVTFDEGTGVSGCCGDAHGGRIATIISGPGVRKHTVLRRAYTHYSLLRTLENAFGLDPLRAAARARSLRAAFLHSPKLPGSG